MNYIWFGIILLLSLIELITMDLLAVWYIISGIIVIIISIYIDSFLIQFVCFILIGLILLFGLRPYVKKYIIRIKIKNNIKNLINKEGIVTREADINEGEVEINNVVWPVVATSKIKVGKRVKVDSIKNFVIMVSVINDKKVIKKAKKN